MGLHLLDDTLTHAERFNKKTKREKRLLRLFDKLRRKAVREPHTPQQKLDRINLDRVNKILLKRYGWF